MIGTGAGARIGGWASGEGPGPVSRSLSKTLSWKREFENLASLEYSSLGLVAAYLIAGVVCKFNVVVVSVISVASIVSIVRKSKHGGTRLRGNIQAAGESTRE